MTAAEPRVRVWDPFVRLFHWGLVAAIAAAWLTAEEAERAHELVGWAVLVLVGLRLLWGGIGPRHARFDRFLRAPGAVVAYLRGLPHGTSPRHLGHNPAGGAMALALIVVVAATGVSGWAMTTPMLGGEALEELHEGLANAMLALVALHVVGVIVSSLAHHENLVRAMLTGRKRAPAEGDVK